MTWGILRVGTTAYELNNAQLMLGRDPACDVVLDDPSISRQQACLYFSAGRVEIENLSQTNPTYVRGNLVLGRTEVRAGDPIEMGNLRAEIQISAPKPCPHCGKILARPNAAFCPYCGKPQRAAPIHDTQQILSAHKLIIQVAGSAPVEFPLDRPTLTLGRAPSNDIVINHPFISANHARLEHSDTGYRIVDLGSLNGLLLNGVRVADHVLHHQDVIRIGDTFGNSVMITYQDTMTPATAAPRRLDLAQQTTLIGRDPGAPLHLDAPSVSWHHARVEWDGARHTLCDLRSTNGTFVNGARIQRQVLQPNDVVQIGPFQLTYDHASLAQFNIIGNVRLDARHLTRRIAAKTGARVILDDVSLSIQPREFVGVVGASGAGKTTLLSALSGLARADGVVLINGADLYRDYEAYRAMLGFVPQQNIIHHGLPVISALRYAAKLRLPPDWTNAQIEQRIHQVMRMVEIEPQRDQLVGKLSGGQIKRVSIAVELLAQPALFFLDEPTSGLDPGLEKKMMYTLRRLADQGQTIILVTHATANIDQCSKVAFLANGRLVFFGTPDEARTFFQSPNAAQPADFSDIYTELARVANPQNPDQVAQEWQTRFQQSPYYKKYVEQPLQSTPAGASAARIAPPRRPQISRVRQGWILTRRNLEVIARDRVTLFVLLAVMPLIGLLVLLIADPTSLVGESANRVAQSPTYLKFGNAEKLLFVMSLAATMLGLFASAYEIVRERAIYQRERMVNLSILAYIFSKVGVLFLFSLAQAFLFLSVIALKVELPAQGAFLPAPLEMYITLVLATLASISLGLLISAFARNDRVVIYFGLIGLFAQILFAGVIFTLPGFAQPLSWLTISHWTMDALGSTVDLRQLSSLDKIAGVPVLKETWDVNYGHTAPHLVSRWVVLVGFAGVLTMLTCFRQKMKDEI